jgi:hypothetical protein
MAETLEPGGSPGKTENILTKKIGPLPTFLWLGIAALAYYLWEKKKAGTTAASTASTTPYPTEQGSPIIQIGSANANPANTTGGVNNPSSGTTPVPSSTAPSPPATSPGAPLSGSFATTSGGTATGQAGGATYQAGLGGPAGGQVPTTVNGIAMPMPTGTGAGTTPTAAQVAAASTIPYTAPGNSSGVSGINYAAIDALAGLGYPGGSK